MAKQAVFTRLDEELLAKVKSIAERDKRTLQATMEIAVTQFVAQQTAAAKKQSKAA